MGQPTAAVGHLDRGMALYDRAQHASQTFLYGGHDPGACCRYHLALTHWLLGHPDQALVALHEALRLADELKHPLTSTITLWFAACVHYHRGERAATTATAERLVALASAHELARWGQVEGNVLLALMKGEPLTVEALAELHRQLVAAGGARWRHVFCLCVLGELYADARHAEEGRRVLATITEEDRGAFYAPEVYRIEGELSLRGSTPATRDAERCFRTAIDLARRRGEKSLELRAATSLARLWQQEGKRDDARRLLADIYGWFTEGFDTADLKEAKALLAEL
jgi:hypothetical protein